MFHVKQLKLNFIVEFFYFYFINNVSRETIYINFNNEFIIKIKNFEINAFIIKL